MLKKEPFGIYLASFTLL